MTSRATRLRDPGQQVRLLPHGHTPREVTWGHCWQVGTPAYWIALTRETCTHTSISDSPVRHRLGGTLAEEIAACVLGGHGIPHHVGLAAFKAVRDSGALSPSSRKPVSIADVLGKPIRLEDREIRYRFAAQRSAYLQMTLDRMHNDPPPSDALGLRRWLLACRGIGPKTASWIVRNHLGSNDVAIIDIHVLRAGIAAGVFDRAWNPARHYDLMEALFLAWARHGRVSAADLDAVIWSERARWPAGYAIIGAAGQFRVKTQQR
ncbi:MAG: hypothetical protein PGN37_08745 [Mycobacterium kyogaense]|uniref:8-oxoguanine DNA glycosylase n=1 Tax=Mycobacterium kyogaense TaxID=2212479 RepID=UPI002FF6F068